MPTELAFWTRLTHWRYILNLKAPEGQEAHVTVHLHDGESFEPGVVSFDPPWLVFQASDHQKHVSVIAVREEAISHVEISLEPKDERTAGGLSVRANPDDFFEDAPEA